MEFPDTIEGFGYEFSKDGKLQQIDTGEPFKFAVKEDDHAYNQKRYEALGELITPVIYNLLEEKCGLKRHPVPTDAKEKEPSTFIFCSENFSESDKLLILIHGSGVVRAGQWARRLIINDCLNSGTQIPFIERGMKEGYGILVMNTNDNDSKDFRKRIRGSESPESHGKYVWENYVRNCKAKKIAIIAHSYGGVVTTSLYNRYKKEFEERVFAIAMTDSVHFVSSDISYLMKIGRNWVTSQLPLDSQVSRRFKDVPCVSAGCLQHEMTSWSSFESIFKFFYEKLLPVSELSKHEARLPSTYFRHSISSDEEVAEGNKESKLKIDLEATVEVDEVTENENLHTEIGEVTKRESLPAEVTKRTEILHSEVGEDTEGKERSHTEVAEETTERGNNLDSDVEMEDLTNVADNKNGKFEDTEADDKLKTEEKHENESTEKTEEVSELTKEKTEYKNGSGEKIDEGKESLLNPSDSPDGARHSKSNKQLPEPSVPPEDENLESSLKKLKCDKSL